MATLEKVNGLTHPSVARACGHLGAVLELQGSLGGARAHYERALQIDEQFYGTIHPNIAGRAMQLGRVLRALEDKEGAQALFERATSILANASELKPAGATD
jgi:tetratricopeptide (TPR) repeat protein